MLLRKLVMAEDSPNVTMQHVAAFQCGHSVLAGVHVL